MRQISQWLQLNKLYLNVKLLNFIALANKNKRFGKDFTKVVINGTGISGVTIEERLRWKEHINLVCTKVARSLGVIRKTCGLVNQLSTYFIL